MTTIFARISLPICLLLLAACGPDLPPGWEDAASIEDFTQAACEGSPYGSESAELTFAPGAGQVAIEYEKAHFRCGQKVEGFFKTSDLRLDILVQPRDMDPGSVAKCDCLYAISMTIKGLAAGEHTVSVFRRWDAHGGGDTTPQLEGSSDVLVP